MDNWSNSRGQTDSKFCHSRHHRHRSHHCHQDQDLICPHCNLHTAEQNWILKPYRECDFLFVFIAHARQWSAADTSLLRKGKGAGWRSASVGSSELWHHRLRKVWRMLDLDCGCGQSEENHIKSNAICNCWYRSAGHIWIFYYSNAKRLAVCCHENIKCELTRSGWAGLNLAIVEWSPVWYWQTIKVTYDARDIIPLQCTL